MGEDQTIWSIKNPNALHYRLYLWRARAYNVHVPYYQTNFCQYFWAVFWSVPGIPFYPFYRFFKMVGNGVGWLLEFIDDHGGYEVGQALDKGVRWFTGKRFGKFVYPWTIALTGIVGYMIWVLPVAELLRLLMYVAILFVICCLMLGGIFAALILADRRETRRFMRMQASSAKPSNAREVSMLDVVISGLKRTKRRLCPLINLPTNMDSTNVTYTMNS